MTVVNRIPPAVQDQVRELTKWDEDVRRIVNNSVKQLCDITATIRCSNSCYLAMSGGLRRNVRKVGTDCTMLCSDQELLVCAAVQVTITLPCAVSVPGMYADITNIGCCLTHTSEGHCMYPCESITYQAACSAWRIV